MSQFISKKNLRKFISSNNFNITDSNFNILFNKLNNKNSIIFSNLNSITQEGGKISLPSDYFGTKTSSYSSLLPDFPTEVSTPNAISEYTRPPIISSEFPLMNGGGNCPCSIMSGGCGSCKKFKKNKQNKKCNKCKNGCTCSQNGGCLMCSSLFTKTSIKNISKSFNINNQNLENIMNYQLKNTMNNLFSSVKNRNNLIGITHINKLKSL